MAKAVFCLADEAQASDILSQLQAAGFSSNEVSVLWPDSDNRFGLAHDKATKAPEGATTGATTGGVVGGVLGWLAGIGALAIPGLGAFVAAGPIMATLSGAAIGATLGGLTGALVGLGIPEFEAKRLEEGLRNGQVLISCRCQNNDEAKAVEQIFKNYGGKDICSTTEKSDEQLAKEQNKVFEKQMKDEGSTVVPPRSDVYTENYTTRDYPPNV